MVNKKYLLLAGVCSMMALQPAFAQESNGSSGAQWSGRDMTYRGQSYDVLDSSYVPKSRMDQHRKYLNHQYAFPAKPKNMWELGIGAGSFNVLGDVSPQFSSSYGFHAHVRKAWGYTFSTRLQYIYGVSKGLSYEVANSSFVANEAAWNGTSSTKGWNYPGSAQTANTGVDRNFRTEAHSLNFDLLASTNNIRFHKAKISTSLYGFVGFGAIAWKTRVNALDANYNPYDFQGIATANGTILPIRENYKQMRLNVKNGMDDTYETDAFVANLDESRITVFDNKPLAGTVSLGGGIQIKLGKRVNLQLEERFSMAVGEDQLDGHRWRGSFLSTSNDAVNYLSLGLNFNLGNARKSVEPLYWLNPLDHAYNELSYPRHMILPDPILPDADGDGVTDQFDKCPGTAAGIAVDAHGCPMDTDGDGVPDDRDKQLITPTECQPVDADGVGKCPCPEGCGTAASACGNIMAGSITFTGSSSKLSAASSAQLGTLAAQMQANPTCKVVIMGAGNASKIQQQRSWERVNSIIEQMSEKNGVDRNRFIFQYGQAGDANTVMYRSAMPGEEGPANVPPPFPNLK